MIRKLLLTIALTMILVMSAKAQTVGIRNTENYIWHGFNLYDDSFVHPGVTVDYGNLSIGTVTHAPDARIDNYDNWDAAASYSGQIAGLNVTGGFDYLLLPDGQELQEYSTTIAIPGQLSPRYTIAEALPNYGEQGQFHILGVDWFLGDPNAVNAVVSAEVTYNDGVNPFTGQPVIRDWTHAAAGVVVNIPIGNVTLQPSIYYQHVMEKSINPDENDLWYGLSLQYRL